MWTRKDELVCKYLGRALLDDPSALRTLYLWAMPYYRKRDVHEPSAAERAAGRRVMVHPNGQQK